jgi:hypothetical protein
VVRNLSVQLKKLYSTKVSFCDVGSSGVPIETEYGRVYPGAEVTGMYRYIKTERPDVVIHVRDNWVFTPKFFQTPYDIYDLCRRVGSKLMLYSPVQSMIPPEVADVAKNRCDYQITMSSGVRRFTAFMELIKWIMYTMGLIRLFITRRIRMR